MEEQFNDTLLANPKIEFYLIEPATLRILRSNLTARSNLQLAEAELHQRSFIDITSNGYEPKTR